MSLDRELSSSRSIYFDILYGVIFCLLVLSLGTESYRAYMFKSFPMLIFSFLLSIILYSAGLWYYIKIIPKDKFIKPLTIYVLAVIVINSLLLGIYAPSYVGFWAFLYGLIMFNRYTFFSLLFLSIVGVISRKIPIKYFKKIDAKAKDYVVLIIYLIILTSIPWLIFVCSGKQVI